MIDTYLMRRRSKVGPKYRERDEPVPEAHLWRLVEGMVRSGRLREVSMSENDFQAAVLHYCPDDADRVFARAGLTTFDPAPKAAEDPKPAKPAAKAAPRTKEYDPAETKTRRPHKAPVLVTPPEPLDD